MGWKGVITLVLVCTLIEGCASKIMQTYVGKDVREAVLDYGPPMNALDLAEGQRAFQWTMHKSYTSPIVANTSGNVNKTKHFDWYTSNTTISGGETIHSNCIYTLLTAWDDKTKGWVVTGFRKPKFICE